MQRNILKILDRERADRTDDTILVCPVPYRTEHSLKDTESQGYSLIDLIYSPQVILHASTHVGKAQGDVAKSPQLLDPVQGISESGIRVFYCPLAPCFVTVFGVLQFTQVGYSIDFDAFQ